MSKLEEWSSFIRDRLPTLVVAAIIIVPSVWIVAGQIYGPTLERNRIEIEMLKERLASIEAESKEYKKQLDYVMEKLKAEKETLPENLIDLLELKRTNAEE